MTDNEINNKTQREMLMDLTISAAVQENKLDTVINKLDRHCASEEKWRAVYEKRLRTVEDAQGRHDERLKQSAAKVTGVNAAIAGVMAIIAGWIGTKS